jgi:hypothetical protein
MDCKPPNRENICKNTEAISAEQGISIAKEPRSLEPLYLVATRRSRESLCANLSKLFANSGLQFRHDEPDIYEIITSEDVAIVRLTCALTTRKSVESAVTTEEGDRFLSSSRMVDCALYFLHLAA